MLMFVPNILIFRHSDSGKGDNVFTNLEIIFDFQINTDKQTIPCVNLFVLFKY